jgi:hypothetical protein
LGLWLFSWWDYGFKSCYDHGCLSLVVLCVVMLITSPEESYHLWCVCDLKPPNKGLRLTRIVTMGGGGFVLFLDVYCLGGKCLSLLLVEAEARTGRFLCVL